MPFQFIWRLENISVLFHWRLSSSELSGLLAIELALTDFLQLQKLDFFLSQPWHRKAFFSSNAKTATKMLRHKLAINAFLLRQIFST
jgi:hypothetical protein